MAEPHLLPLPTFDKPVKLLIAVAPYYMRVTDMLVAGARAKAALVGAEVEVLEVPSPLELAPTIAMAQRLAEFDGHVALGCVVQGETMHQDVVMAEVFRSLSMLGLSGACIGNGVLTVESLDQAMLRADPKDQDKGGEAAAAALHLIAISRKWAAQTKGIGFRA